AAIAGAGLFGVQLHGDEPLEMIPMIRRPVVRAMRLSQQREIADAPADLTVLLDAHDDVRRGGTGQTIDWTIAAGLARTRRIVLAGGLTLTNVAAAVRQVAPYAVDVSSGVERSPREKDADLMRAFVEAVATADAEVHA